MKLKKIPYYLLLLLLAAGASLILGLLSFSGMFALWPILPLAFAAFGLSVAYEGEIYFQNIKGALNKLFKPEYLKRELAKDYLLSHFPENTSDDDCPPFFKDYERQLHLLHRFEHISPDKTKNQLDKKSKARKKRVEKTLRDMEKWFAKTLFATHQKNLTPYETKLRDWLAAHEQDEWRAKHDSRQGAFRIAQIGSVLAGLCMGFGTTFLLVEAFTVIPFLAILPIALVPALIIPMAAIAGAAYGLLTYNAVTDMISNDTIRRWYRELSESLDQGITIQNVLLTTAAIALFALTLALTICTAGTWWTVIKQTRPLFTWMSKIPPLVAQGFTAFVIASSTFVFNLGNTLETLSLIKDIDIVEFFTEIGTSIQENVAWLQAHETGWQIVNPFRLLLKLTITPLRILLFIGHLISIGVTSDRVPGIPEILSALLGIISEGFEDAHYFVDQEHAHEHTHDTKSMMQERLTKGHGHNHDLDLPTRILKGIFYPLYCAAALWDSLMSKPDDDGNPSLCYENALKKQMGIFETSFKLPKKALSPSVDWQNQHIIHLIERQKEKLTGSGLAEEKRNKLTQLQDDIVGLNDKVVNRKKINAVIRKRIKREAGEVIYDNHRITPDALNRGQQTNTRIFLSQLIDRSKSPTSVVDVLPMDNNFDLPPDDFIPLPGPDKVFDDPKKINEKDCPTPNCPSCPAPVSLFCGIAAKPVKKKRKPIDQVPIDDNMVPMV